MSKFKVFEDTHIEVNDSSGPRSATFKAGVVVPADDNEGDFLVRCLVPWGLAKKVSDSTPVTDSLPDPAPASVDPPAPADTQEGN